jgi:aromatic ring-opening dioxygenase LigB subunit
MARWRSRIPSVWRVTEPAAGGSKDSEIHVEFDVDRDFARTLGESAPANGVPVAMVHYGATSGPHDLYPLDWGGLVPLWFMGERFEPKPRVVVLVPSRALSLETLAAFGRVIADAATATESRVALIASSDLSHAHQEDGPYGYHPAAAELDAWIEQSVKDGDLTRLLHPDMDLVSKAFPDGLWQIAFLTGATQRMPMTGEFLSYEVPTYYGMLCAAYTPARASAQ